MSLTCKILLIGDSLLFGLKTLPNSVNKSVVGNTPIGVEKTLEQDLKACKGKFVAVSLGSNVMFNDFNKQTTIIKSIINKITLNGKVVILMPVPARGKYTQRADKFNNYYKTLKNVIVIPLHKNIRNNMTKDNIHLKRKGYKIWKSQILSVL